MEICKKEYQKLYFEHENLKKKYDDLVTQCNRARKTQLIHTKKKGKLLFLNIFEETESEKSDEESEEEEQTGEESKVDEVIPRKTTKKNTSKKKIAKESIKRTSKKQVGIIDYINI